MPQLNMGDIRANNQDNQVDVKMNSSKGKNTIAEKHIKEWRVVFKAIDILLFIIIFLGLTGYFIGILVIYS